MDKAATNFGILLLRVPDGYAAEVLLLDGVPSAAAYDMLGEREPLFVPDLRVDEPKWEALRP